MLSQRFLPNILLHLAVVGWVAGVAQVGGVFAGGVVERDGAEWQDLYTGLSTRL